MNPNQRISSKEGVDEAALKAASNGDIKQMSTVLSYAEYNLFQHKPDVVRKKYISALKQLILNDLDIARKVFQGKLVLRSKEHIGVGCIIKGIDVTDLFTGQDTAVEGSCTVKQQKFEYPTVIFGVQLFEGEHVTYKSDGSSEPVDAHEPSYNRFDFINEMAYHYIRSKVTGLTERGKFQMTKNTRVLVMPPTNMWQFDNSHTTENVVLNKKMLEEPTYYGVTDTIQASHSVPKQLSNNQKPTGVLAVYLDCIEVVNP